jgi:hypothetical protein
VSKTISHSFAALAREILFLPLEHKIHISSQPSNILYIVCFDVIFRARYSRLLYPQADKTCFQLCTFRADKRNALCPAKNSSVALQPVCCRTFIAGWRKNLYFSACHSRRHSTSKEFVVTGVERMTYRGGGGGGNWLCPLIGQKDCFCEKKKSGQEWGRGGGYDERIMIPVSVLFTNKSCGLPYLES